MYSKLLAARRTAQIGVPTLILPGREPGVIVRAFAAAGACPLATGEAPFTGGTWVRAAGHAIPRRKFWLAYQSDPAGGVHDRTRLPRLRRVRRHVHGQFHELPF